MYNYFVSSLVHIYSKFDSMAFIRSEYSKNNNVESHRRSISRRCATGYFINEALGTNKQNLFLDSQLRFIIYSIGRKFVHFLKFKE